MKKLRLKNFVCVLAAVVMLVLGFSILQPTELVHAADGVQTPFVSAVSKDENFSLTMTATDRTSPNKVFTERKQMVYPNAGEQAEFYLFQWRDLGLLTFNFLHLQNPESPQLVFLNFNFTVTFLQSEDLNLPITGGDTVFENLYSGPIGLFSPFYYYIDSVGLDRDNPTSTNGHDFGLYKFEFSYELFDPSLMPDPSATPPPRSLAPIYVAVIPDDIMEVLGEEAKILYSVSSSNDLLNMFHLYISNGKFKYINPAHLIWRVEGIDKNNNLYCRDEAMKSTDDRYTDFKTVKPSFDDYHGTSFDFDSNGIEGEWEISLILRYKNPNGDDPEYIEIVLDTVSGLSTFKVKKPFPWWWLLLVLLLIVIAVLIVMIIANKKHKKDEAKVW